MQVKGEYILCAAIWFDDGKEYPHQPRNIDTGLVFCGWMHGNIFPQIGGTVGERKKLGIHEKEQGFLTSNNRFVGRKEAAKIAIKCGQIKKTNYFRDQLDSCDLYDTHVEKINEQQINESFKEIFMKIPQANLIKIDDDRAYINYVKDKKIIHKFAIILDSHKVAVWTKFIDEPESFWMIATIRRNDVESFSKLIDDQLDIDANAKSQIVHCVVVIYSALIRTTMLHQINELCDSY